LSEQPWPQGHGFHVHSYAFTWEMLAKYFTILARSSPGV